MRHIVPCIACDHSSAVKEAVYSSSNATAKRYIAGVSQFTNSTNIREEVAEDTLDMLVLVKEKA